MHTKIGWDSNVILCMNYTHMCRSVCGFLGYNYAESMDVHLDSNGVVLGWFSPEIEVL